MKRYIIILAYLFVLLWDFSLATYDDVEDDDEDTRLMRIPVGPVPRASLRQIFHDDFDHMDYNKWSLDTTKSWQGFAFYTSLWKNCYTKNGKMYLRPLLTSDHFGENFLHHGVLDIKKQFGHCDPTWNNGCYKDANKEGIINPVMSCFARSKVSFRYGKVEIHAKWPRGDWLWPALWLLPKTSHYGSAARSGEIDMAETLGNANYGNNGINRQMLSLHFGVDPNHDVHLSKEHILHGTTYADNFYKYTLDWTADHINMYINDIHVFGMETPGDGMYHHYQQQQHGSNIWAHGGKNAPFDQEFYIIMSVGAGGLTGIFPDWVRNYPHPKPWTNRDSNNVAMEKFWQHKNDWYQTWHGEDPAMQVESVTVWTY